MVIYETLEEQPDKYARLSYVLTEYLSDVDDPNSDTLVREFARLNLKVLESQDRADLLRAYCDLQCTTFPLQLLILISSFAKSQFRDHPHFSQFVVQDELETIPIELDVNDEVANGTKSGTGHKQNVLTLENILILLGFTQDNYVQSGLSKMRLEGERKLQLIKEAEEAGSKSPQAETQEQKVLIKLRKALADYFSDQELRALCFDLGILYDNLEGGNLQAKAQDLVTYCKNRAQLTKLIDKIEAERNHLTGHFGSAFQLPEALHPDNLIESGKEICRFVDVAFNYIVSFYGRWFAARDAQLITPYLNYLNNLDPNKPDIMRSFLMVEDLNATLAGAEKLRGDFVGFFNRKEMVPEKAAIRAKRLLKQIVAYQYDYVETGAADQDDIYRRWCLTDTKLLLENTVDLFSYLLEEKVIPEVVLFKRRITAEDGSTRLDWLSEDDERYSRRFDFFVPFCKQVECFFFYLTEEGSPPPVILPVDFKIGEVELL